MRVGVKQGIMQGITVGTTNCVFLCSYALAFWYGSTRVRAGKYDGRPPLASTPHRHSRCKPASLASHAKVPTMGRCAMTCKSVSCMNSLGEEIQQTGQMLRHMRSSCAQTLCQRGP